MKAQDEGDIYEASKLFCIAIYKTGCDALRMDLDGMKFGNVELGDYVVTARRRRSRLSEWFLRILGL